MLDARLTNVAFYAKNIVNLDFGGGKQPNDNRTSEATSSTTDVNAWRRIRIEAKNLVQQYLDNPCDVDLLARSHELVEELESIDDSTESAQFRAKVNVANLTGKMRRSHFTSYVAGKYSVDDRLPAIFKIWLHNAAAHLSLDLMDNIQDIESRLRTIVTTYDYQSDELLRTPDVLKVFANGALEDTIRFLDIADRFGVGEHYSLTRFNMARLAAYRNHPSTAADRIREIQLPQSDDHPAILQWHQDNMNSYSMDAKFQSILKDGESDFHADVLSKLSICSEQASSYIEARGGRDGMWADSETSADEKRNFRLSRTVIAACGAGSASLLLAISPEATEFVINFLHSLMEGLELIPDATVQDLSHIPAEDLSHLSAGSQVALGDGDWAMKFESGVVGATFGDGDWA